MACTPKGISFTLGDLKAKQTIEVNAGRNNTIRATIAKQRGSVQGVPS